MPSLTIRVPNELIESGILTMNGSTAKSAKMFTLESLKTYTKPMNRAPAQVPSVNESIWLSNADLRSVRAVCPADLSDGECVSAILAASLQSVRQKKAEPKAAKKSKLVKSTHTDTGSVMDRMLGSMGRSGRPEQGRIVQAILDPKRKENSVLFCEAGTGIGKTIAYLGAAFSMIEADPAATIVVALPTNALINQIRPDIEQFRSVTKAPVNVRYIRPQRDWVSATALQNFIENQQDIDPIIAQKMIDWLPSDAASLDEWLISNFLHEFPDFTFADSIAVNQRVSDDDLGYAAYQSQFAESANANLIVMTHAMLAVLTRINLRKRMRQVNGNQELAAIKAQWRADKEARIGSEEIIDRLYTRVHAYLAQLESPDEQGNYHLPKLHHLIIDEAHKFEDAMASAFSQTISIRRLIEQIDDVHQKNANALSQIGIDRLKEFGEALAKKSGMDTEEISDISLIDTLATLIKGAIHVNSKAPAKWRDAIKKTPVYRRALFIVKSIEADLEFHKFGGKISVFLGSSPVRGYPQITIGQPYLGKPFDFLYRNMTGQTTLMSGTLYTGTPPSSESSRRALGVPIEFKLDMSPIESPWQIAPVTLHVVTKAADGTGRGKFIRPSQSKLDEQEYARLYEAWVNDVSNYTLEAWSSAAGGVLVLTSSFADIERVSGYLAHAGLGSDLMVHQRGMDVHALRERFIEESRRADSKPLMIATGAAWTGLDIHDQNQENLLTDLIILNTPIGVADKNAASLRRLTSKGRFYELAHHATVLVRQSAGRLVRSPDTLANRRLHWLDARIHEDTCGKNNWRAIVFSPIKAFLGRYRKIDVA